MIVSLLKIWYGNSTVIWLKSDRKAIAGLYAVFIAYGLAVCGIRRKRAMEIERKFLIEKLPEDLGQYPVWCLEQAYLCREPVIRVRKEEYKEKKEFILTYKSDGLMEREEYNLPLTQESYLHLKAKADGRIITKKRYRIPEKSGLMIELDIFEGDLEGLIMAEVEFPDKETANAYQPPEWFGKEVTFDKTYHNSNLSKGKE